MTLRDWQWVGFAGMVIGSVLILTLGSSWRTRDENEYRLHLFVCLTAMALYLVIASGDGAIRLADRRDFYFACYGDWAAERSSALELAIPSP